MARPRRTLQQRRRKEQARVTEPLTPKGVRQQTRAATNLRFRPLERAAHAELRASGRRGKEVGDWWQNYLAQVNQGRGETEAAYQQAGAANQAQIGQASTIDNANTAQLQAEAQKSAELRGTTASNAPAEREGAMQAQRNYLAAAQGGALQRAGANQFAYLTDQKRIGVGQSIASRKEEGRRGTSIRKDISTIAKERGDYAATKRQELRDKEFEKQVQNRAFPLEKRKAAFEEREGGRKAGLESEDNRRQNEEQRNENTKTRRERGKEKRERNKERREGKKGGRTPAEVHEARAGQRNAQAKAKQLVEAHGYPKSAKEWADLEEAVAKEAEVSPAEARTAIKRMKGRKKRQGEQRKENSEEGLEGLPPGR